MEEEDNDDNKEEKEMEDNDDNNEKDGAAAPGCLWPSHQKPKWLLEEDFSTG